MNTGTGRSGFRFDALIWALVSTLATAGGSLLPWPWVGLVWWLDQPLLAYSGLLLLGTDPASGALPRAAPGHVMLFSLSLIAALALVGAPGWMLLQSGSVGWVLLFGVGLALAWLLLWPRWPLLLVGWLPRIPGLEPSAGFRPWGLARSLAAQGAEPDQHPALPLRGLLAAAIALALLLLGPLVLWFADILPLPSASVWTGAALLSLLGHVGLFAMGLHARREQLEPEYIEFPASASASVARLEPEQVPEDPVDALYAALRGGRADAALALIESAEIGDASPPPYDRDQRSALMLAAVLSDLRPLRALIARGTDLNQMHAGLTPLLAATRDSYQGRVEAVTTLLTNGADARAVDAEGHTPLHHAARSSDPAVAALLLDAGADMEAENRAGLTPLGAACACGNWRLARFLLDHGAAAHRECGQPPLLAAASGDDDPAGVRLLLRHRARVDARGAFERTALHSAALAGNAEIVAALIEAGADVDARDARGVAPLHEAARAGADAVVDRLGRADVQPNALDASACNALNIACRSARAGVATVRALLRIGVDPEHRGEDGRSPLQQAEAGGRWALVAALDPAHPLPASVHLGEDETAALQPLPKRLARLLLDGRHAMAQATLDHEPLQDSEQALELALELAGHDSRAVSALGWLWRHGLLAGVIDRLVDELLDRGGENASALQTLLECGASVAGSGRLAHYLAASVAGEHASRGCEQLALLLLDHGADPFAPAVDHEPCVVLAVRQGWIRLLEQLLAMGCDPDARRPGGRSALQQACAMGLTSAVRTLVRHGASAELRSADGQTARGVALAGGHRELLQWLEWGEWKPPRRPLRGSDLSAAAGKGDSIAVSALLDLGLPIDARDSQGCSALLRAAGCGHVDTVELLLQRGADSGLSADSGATALSAAISMGHLPVVDLLLRRGAEVDRVLPGGATPLMVAAALGHADIVERLYRGGANVEHRDEQDNAALLAAAQHVASRGRRGEARALMEPLLRAGADPDRVNSSGDTAVLLLLGARLEPGARIDEDAVLEALETLLSRSVDLSAQDRRGYGPLHLAALHGLPRVVTRLLSAGARPALRDHLGRSAHDVAVMRGFIDVAHLFEPRNQPSMARFLRPPEP